VQRRVDALLKFQPKMVILAFDRTWNCDGEEATPAKGDENASRRAKRRRRGNGVQHESPTRKQLLASLTLSRFIVTATAAALQKQLPARVRLAGCPGEADGQILEVLRFVGATYRGVRVHVFSPDSDHSASPQSNAVVRCRCASCLSVRKTRL
jgi:hypothetical protein